MGFWIIHLSLPQNDMHGHFQPISASTDQVLKNLLPASSFFKLRKTKGASAEAARKMMLAGVSPWNLPPRQKIFEYQEAGAVTDLARLLKIQAGDNHRVTVVMFNEAVIDLMRNNIYSLNTIGEVANYIVVALDSSSLDYCLDMNLPCFDGSTLISAPDTQGEEQVPESEHYISLTWLKPQVVYQVLKLGYDVHFSDTDVAYFGNVHDFWSTIMQEGAMIAGMRGDEDPSIQFNVGLMFIRSNARTLALYERWLSEERTEGGDGDVFDNVLMKDQSLMQRCKYGQNCEEISSVHPSVVPYRVFGNVGSDFAKRSRCLLEESRNYNICGRTEPFIHINGCHGTDKRNVLKTLGLWYLTDCSSKTGKYNGRYPRCTEVPLLSFAPGQEMINSNLPCKAAQWLSGFEEKERETFVAEQGLLQ